MKKMILCLVAVVVPSTCWLQSDWPEPYNPDVDTDGIIGVQDLVGFLQVFGTYWDPVYGDFDPTNEIQKLVLEDDTIWLRPNPALAITTIYGLNIDDLTINEVDSLLQPYTTFVPRSVLQGEAGADGPQGPEGLPGPAGNEGASAYETWLDLGGVGSESDFLNAIADSCTLDNGESVTSVVEELIVQVDSLSAVPAFSFSFPDGTNISSVVSVNLEQGDFTVPAGKNLYVSSFHAKPQYSGGLNDDGIFCNGFRFINTDCDAIYSQGYLFPENSVISFFTGSYYVGGTACTNFNGDFCYLEGFLIDKVVDVIFQNSTFEVPDGFLFVKYNPTSPLPSFYEQGAIVPSKTMGYLLNHN